MGDGGVNTVMGDGGLNTVHDLILCMVQGDIEQLRRQIRETRTDRRPDYLTDLALDSLYEELRQATAETELEEIDRIGDVREEIEALGLDPDEVLPKSPP